MMPSTFTKNDSKKEKVKKSKKTKKSKKEKSKKHKNGNKSKKSKKGRRDSELSMKSFKLDADDLRDKMPEVENPEVVAETVQSLKTGYDDISNAWFRISHMRDALIHENSLLRAGTCISVHFLVVRCVYVKMREVLVVNHVAMPEAAHSHSRRYLERVVPLLTYERCHHS